MNTKLQQRQLTWDDIPECVAYIASLIDGIDQCSLQMEGWPALHLLLMRDGLLSITEVHWPDNCEPDDRLLIALGRVLVAHRRACKEGRTLLS